MKKSLLLILTVLVNTVVFSYYLLGLMHLQPLYIAGPLQFLALLATVYVWNRKKRFRGFHKEMKS